MNTSSNLPPTKPWGAHAHLRAVPEFQAFSKPEATDSALWLASVKGHYEFDETV